ncbi:uncharacterized protein LOC141909933 [Tubulanus polymorphus]|uniref:uncharacterized protein LOC141909933 n=1 Tax=Tubulanus polymorphus TaxID=672921 RepID=UPI003DA5C126
MSTTFTNWYLLTILLLCVVELTISFPVTRDEIDSARSSSLPRDTADTNTISGALLTNNRDSVKQMNIEAAFKRNFDRKSINANWNNANEDSNDFKRVYDSVKHSPRSRARFNPSVLKFLQALSSFNRMANKLEEIGYILIGQSVVDSGQPIEDSDQSVVDRGQLVVDMGQLVTDSEKFIKDNGLSAVDSGQSIADSKHSFMDSGQLATIDNRGQYQVPKSYLRSPVKSTDKFITTDEKREVNLSGGLKVTGGQLDDRWTSDAGRKIAKPDRIRRSRRRRTNEAGISSDTANIRDVAKNIDRLPRIPNDKTYYREDGGSRSEEKLEQTPEQRLKDRRVNSSRRAEAKKNNRNKQNADVKSNLAKSGSETIVDSVPLVEEIGTSGLNRNVQKEHLHLVEKVGISKRKVSAQKSVIPLVVEIATSRQKRNTEKMMNIPLVEKVRTSRWKRSTEEKVMNAPLMEEIESVEKTNGGSGSDEFVKVRSIDETDDDVGSGLAATVNISSSDEDGGESENIATSTNIATTQLATNVTARPITTVAAEEQTDNSIINTDRKQALTQNLTITTTAAPSSGETLNQTEHVYNTYLRNVTEITKKPVSNPTRSTPPDMTVTTGTKMPDTVVINSTIATSPTIPDTIPTNIAIASSTAISNTTAINETVMSPSTDTTEANSTVATSSTTMDNTASTRTNVTNVSGTVKMAVTNSTTAESPTTLDSMATNGTTSPTILDTRATNGSIPTRSTIPDAIATNDTRANPTNDILVTDSSTIGTSTKSDIMATSPTSTDTVTSPTITTKMATSPTITSDTATNNTVLRNSTVVAGASRGFIAAIVVCSIVGFWIIIGPLICIGCKIKDYVADRRVKEHGEGDVFLKHFVKIEPRDGAGENGNTKSNGKLDKTTSSNGHSKNGSTEQPDLTKTVNGKTVYISEEEGIVHTRL